MFTMSRSHVISLLTRQIPSLVILLLLTLASPVKAALHNGTEAAMNSSHKAGLLSNRPPVAGDDSGPGYITGANTPFITKDVLENDRDPDGDFLSVVGFDTSKTIGQVSHLPDGQLDPTFHDDGKVIVDFSGRVDTGNAVVIQTDDKIIVAGRSGDDFALARLNPDGTLDEGFGQNGKVTTDFSGGNDVGNAVLMLPDGKIVVVGGAGVDIAVARYNSNGSLDTSFNSNGKVTTHFLCGDAAGNGAVLQPDGKIVVAGGACGDFTVVRYKTDGSLDASFDSDGIVTTDFSGGNDTGNAVVLGDGGKIIVAGDAAGDFGIIRYNANGSLDSNFGSDGKVTTDFNGNYDYGKTALIQPDGKILVAGIQGITCIGLARYNPDGSLDLSFNGNGKVGMDCEPNEYNNAIALQRDGKIILAGNVGYNGSVQFILIRLNSDGSLDPNFDGDGVLYTDFGGMDYAHSVTLQTDNKIVVLGSTNVSGNGDFALARYNMSGIFYYDPNHKFDSLLLWGQHAFDTFTYVLSDGVLTNTATVTITVHGITSYIYLPIIVKPPLPVVSGGLDGSFGGGSGKVITSFGGGSSEAHAVAIQKDGKIVVAGSASNGSNTYFALARYNADGSLDTSFGSSGMITTSFGSSSSGESIAIQSDGKIIVAGSTGDDFAIARYNPDGSLDTTFDGDGKVTTDFGAFDAGHSVVIQSDGKIVVGGSSISRPENPPYNGGVEIARYNLDGSLDASFNGNGKVRFVDYLSLYPDYVLGSIAIQPDGKIVWVGDVIDFASVRYPIIFRINSNGSIDGSFDVYGWYMIHYYCNSLYEGSMNTSVAILPGGKIIVAGQHNLSFVVARYNMNGSLDTSFNGNGYICTDFKDKTGVDRTVATSNAIVIQPDGKIIVGGSIGYDAKYDFAIARYNPDGSLDTSFDGNGKVITDFGGDDTGNGLALQPDGKIVMVGYTSIDGYHNIAVARYYGKTP